MKPLPDSTWWIDSGPEPITQDLAGAVLIVRIGMASNALSAQLNAGHDATGGGDRSEAVKKRDLVTSFATMCALTFEAIRLAQENMAVLRGLASVGCKASRSKC